MADDQTNYEATKDDVLAQFKGAQLELMEAVAVLIEAHASDVEEAFEVLGDENAALKLRVLETMVAHAWKIVMGYAGFAVAMGQKVGTIDDDGNPTATMPDGLGAALGDLNENLAQFKDMYEEFIVADEQQPVAEKENG